MLTNFLISECFSIKNLPPIHPNVIGFAQLVSVFPFTIIFICFKIVVNFFKECYVMRILCACTRVGWHVVRILCASTRVGWHVMRIMCACTHVGWHVMLVLYACTRVGWHVMRIMCASTSKGWNVMRILRLWNLFL